MPVLPGQLALTSPADGALAVAADIRNANTAIQTEANALLTILGAGTTGQVLTSGGGTTVAWGPAYTAYTPTWTSSGTAPAIGNAVVTAFYAQLGKLVHAYGRIVFGGTTTFGTGTYNFALPVNGALRSGAIRVLGSVDLLDSSANARGVAVAETTAAGLHYIVFAATYLGAGTVAGQLAPWTWAVSDEISWNLVYEAA